MFIRLMAKLSGQSGLLGLICLFDVEFYVIVLGVKMCPIGFVALLRFEMLDIIDDGSGLIGLAGYLDIWVTGFPHIWIC